MKTESLPNFDSEDIFAKAIERVEAGEPIEAVLATAPAAMRAELREVLLLITATHHLQREPVPQPPAPRRADRKKAFLEAAAQMKAEAALDASPVVTPVVAAKALPVKPRQAKPQRFTALANFWRDLLASFTSPNFSPVPLAVLIATVYLGAFGFYTAAEAAGLGDITYPVKQWMDYQALSLSPETVRPAVYGGIQIRLVEDVLAAHTKLGAEEAASGHKAAVISTESFLVVNKVDGEYLIIGPLHVLLRYQPDPNLDEYLPTVMSGLPAIGSQVELTFQVISDADGKPTDGLVVQGRALRVINSEGQLTFDNSVAATPVPPPPPSSECDQNKEPGWMPYLVSSESLAEIAEKTGTTVEKLIEVNCLEKTGGVIPAQMAMILAPKPLPTSTPTPTAPPLVATLTVYAEKTLTPSVELTATVAPIGTPVMTATVVPTGTVALTTTAEVTVTATVTETPAPTATITETLVQTPTAVETPNATVSATVSATVTVTSTMTGTGQPTENADLKGTLTATAPISGGVEPPTGTPIAPPATATSTPATEATADEGTTTPAPTATLPATSGESPTAVATPTPTAASNNGGSGTTGQTAPTATDSESAATRDGSGTRPVATATPLPQSRSPLTGG